MAVYDIPAGDLYWDETNQTVHQSAGDTFGLTSDPDATTGIYGYHATSQVGLATATATAMTPTVLWSGISPTVTQYYPGGVAHTARLAVFVGA